MIFRNALFSIGLCAFLCGPAILYGATRAGIDVPVDLTAAPAQYLSGGAESANVGEQFSVEGFTSKALQEAVDTEIGNYIPGKAAAIITNAGMQRRAIACSNSLWQWSCYPTYFGSARLFIPGEDAVTYLPQRSNVGAEAAWRSFAEGVAQVAERHPDKRFVLYVAGGYQEPSVNPAYDLVTDPLVPSYCVDALRAVAGDVPNVSVLSYSYSSSEEYYRDFFRTDHHWNAFGAFRAYESIAEELGLSVVEPGGKREIPDYWFTGATARWGVDLLRERVSDCGNTFADLVAERPDGTKISGDDHSSFWDAPALGKRYQFYDTYYDNLGDCTITGGFGDRNALLVSNSYRGALQRPLASSYRSLSVNSQLHPAVPLTTTLEEQIEAAGAEDVIFAANPSAFKIEDEYWE